MLDRLLDTENHDEREEIVKSDARQRFKRMIVVTTLFVIFALGVSAVSDEPSTTQRLIELCKLF